MDIRIITSLLLWMFSANAYSHVVHASNIDVTVNGNRVEVLQTTPITDAKSIAKQLGAKHTDYQATLSSMAKGWQISAGDAKCQLSKQAYRLAHHDSQLQLRYLFSCDKTPESMVLPWFSLAPKAHFIIMKLSINDKSNTVIFQHQDLVIDLV